MRSVHGQHSLLVVPRPCDNYMKLEQLCFVLFASCALLRSGCSIHAEVVALYEEPQLLVAALLDRPVTCWALLANRHAALR